MRISDWSSDVCSSDLIGGTGFRDDTALDEYGPLERLAFKGGSAPHLGRGQAPLIKGDGCRKPDGCRRLRLLKDAPRQCAGERAQIIVVAAASNRREPGQARCARHADIVARGPCVCLCGEKLEIGRASCREKSGSVRVDSGGSRTLKKKNKVTKQY